MRLTGKDTTNEKGLGLVMLLYFDFDYTDQQCLKIVYQLHYYIIYKYPQVPGPVLHTH